MARLLKEYRDNVAPALKDKLGIKNPMAVPRLSKVVVSMGVGEAARDKNRMEPVMANLTKITGQKPQICRARKSVSNFKLREGMEVGCRVTLRGARMYEFIERLINAALPRMRDFRGLKPTGFDGRGNFSMGLADESIFPEIDAGNIQVTQGMNLTFVTTAVDDAGARELLTQMGMPFRRKEQNN